MPSDQYVKSKTITQELEFSGKYLLFTWIRRHFSVKIRKLSLTLEDILESKAK